MEFPIKNLINKYWQYLLLFTIVFVLYGNTLKNKYSLDDDFVIENNVKVQKGISGIPYLFVNRYSISKDKTFGYRPITLVTFAIEYSLFGENTFVSHLINVLIFLFISIVLLKLLLQFFYNYSPYFIWLVLLLFIAHPAHTEVVASLKNRDELLSFLFSILSLYSLIKYINNKKIINILYSIIFFVLAYLSKQSAVAFVLLIPLSLYFFTEIKIKKVIIYLIIFLVVFVLVQKMPRLFLPKAHRINEFFENPLFFNDSIIERLLTAIYSAFFYLKLVLFPKYLSFYYGYNTLPIGSVFSFKSIFSIVFHLSIFIYAIIKLPKKHPLSFGILFYLISISIFLNLVRPVMGIVADRYLFSAIFGFSIIVVYLVFAIFKVDITTTNLKISNNIMPFLIFTVVLLLYSVKTINRNNDWYNRETLFSADVGHLKNSAKANELLANTYFYNASHTKVKNREYVKNMQQSVNYYRKSLNIYKRNNYMLNDLAYVYMSINKPDSALLYLNMVNDTANVNTLFNKAQAYELKKNYKKSISFYNQVIKLEPINEKALMKLSMLYNHIGKLDKAINVNLNFIDIDKNNETPYLNLANLYYINGDTAKAINFAEKAVNININNKKTIGLIYNYYKGIGDSVKTDYYYQLYND